MTSPPSARPQAEPRPDISVLLPVFNGEKFLNEAIASVLAQDHDSFELVVVDDGSTDGTKGLLSDFALDPRVVVVTNDANQGLVPSLNTGIANCRGDLIARLDADDVMLPKRLSLQQKLFRSEPSLVLAATGYERHSPTGELLVRGTPLPTHAALAIAMLGGNRINHASVMFRRQAVLEVGGYDAQWFPVEDYDLWLRLLEVGTYAGLPDFLVRSLNDPDGISISREQEQLSRMRARAVEYGRRFTEQAPDFGYDEVVLTTLGDLRRTRALRATNRAIRRDLQSRSIPTTGMPKATRTLALSLLRSRSWPERHLLAAIAEPKGAAHALLRGRSGG